MAKKQSSSEPSVFQLKIALLDIEPAIWRRIQVTDCTLDDLHEHIQTAMGWTNSHLHVFDIGGVEYGDPDLLEDGFDERDFEDSLATQLSRVLGKRRKGFRFRYVYDFGDGWDHEITFEGCVPFDPSIKYPVCLEGERARPPEDCGGAWGYSHLLEVLANPKHEEYERLREWAGDCDPEKFSAEKTTHEMHEGLPDWRLDGF